SVDCSCIMRVRLSAWTTDPSAGVGVECEYRRRSDVPRSSAGVPGATGLGGGSEGAVEAPADVLGLVVDRSVFYSKRGLYPRSQWGRFGRRAKPPSESTSEGSSRPATRRARRGIRAPCD